MLDLYNLVLNRASSAEVWGLALSSLPDGLYVLDIAPHSPAALAGILPGDKICAVNGRYLGEGSRGWFVKLAIRYGTTCHIMIERPSNSSEILHRLRTQGKSEDDAERPRAATEPSMDKVEELGKEEGAAASGSLEDRGLKRFRFAEFDFSSSGNAFRQIDVEPPRRMEATEEDLRHSDRQLMRHMGVDAVNIPADQVPNVISVQKEEEQKAIAREMRGSMAQFKAQGLVMTEAERRGQLEDWDSSEPPPKRSIRDLDPSARNLLDLVSTDIYSAYW